METGASHPDDVPYCHGEGVRHEDRCLGIHRHREMLVLDVVVVVVVLVDIDYGTDEIEAPEIHHFVAVVEFAGHIAEDIAVAEDIAGAEDLMGIEVAVRIGLGMGIVDFDCICHLLTVAVVDLAKDDPDVV
jgi:hypothetical protein